MNSVTTPYQKLESELARIGFVTHDQNLLAKIDKVTQVASSDISIVLTGASGSGKNLLAYYIHTKSRRNRAKFITLDSGCLSPNLIESELFGHEKGAFTGALNAHTGALERAQGGTLFLDEIGELSVHLQKKLLRAIETKSITHLGGEKEIQLDFRLISATNKNLKKMVKAKKFRKDLFFRLHESSLHLPPLRERRGDISLLARHFISLYNKEFNKKVMSVSTIAMTYLENYSWPGNVRELKNVIKSAVASVNRDTLWVEDLPLHFDHEKQPVKWHGSIVPLEQMKKQYVSYVLNQYKWNKSKTAQALKISRPRLDRIILRHGLE